MGADLAAFRDAAGQFATGIAVVATATDGVTHAMTVNAFTSVSLDPLLILVCGSQAPPLLSRPLNGARPPSGPWPSRARSR